MREIKISWSLKNLQNALKRLGEALQENPSNELIVDGTIQRFEFVIELFWKTLKRLLEREGIHTSTPKETLKKAYASNWLKDETIWLEMLYDRNQMSHLYDEAKAKEIYQHIQIYFPVLETTFEFLKKKSTDS